MGGRVISLMPESLREGHTDISITQRRAVFTEITRTQFEVPSHSCAHSDNQRPAEVDPSAADSGSVMTLNGNPNQSGVHTALAPRQADFSMLAAPPARILQRSPAPLGRADASTVTARDSFEDGQKSHPDRKRARARTLWTESSLPVIETVSTSRAKPQSHAACLSLNPPGAGPDSSR